MVSDALQFAEEFKAIERNAKETLCTCGAGLPLEAVADILERLEFRRSCVCSWLCMEIVSASKAEERRELLAVLWAVDAA